MLIQQQIFYEPYTGVPHIIDIVFAGKRIYNVLVDDEFYATAEHRLGAFEEVADIIRNYRWSPIYPL